MTIDKTITNFGQIPNINETLIENGYFHFGFYCEFNKADPKILTKLGYDNHYGDVAFDVLKSFGKIMTFIKFDLP